MHQISSSLRLRILFIISVFIATLFIPNISKAASISVWWPVNDVTVAGTQPFKALIDGSKVEEYQMYWQVDGGDLNKMDNNYQDYPHKEYSVDLTGWQWKGAGPYNVNFIAKDDEGKIIGEKQIRIYTENSSGKTNIDKPFTPVEDTNPIKNDEQTDYIQTNDEPVSNDDSKQVVAVQPSPTFIPNPAYYQSNVWWPTDNAVVTGLQPFKAIVDGISLSDYNMYWKVDEGQLNKMDDNYKDYPHKEVLVDLSGWNWKGRGPYVLSFISKDNAGKLISEKKVTIYTAPDNSRVLTVPSPAPTLTPTITPTPVVEEPKIDPVIDPITETKKDSANPLSGLKFYINPDSNAKKQAEIWQNSRSADALEMTKISSQPEAKWLGDWNNDIYTDTKNYVDKAEKTGTVPVLIAYNIPSRDCGSYSAGGTKDSSAYRSWIKSLANGIGNRKAVVILEPDALSLIDCLSDSAKKERFALIEQAILTLKENPGTIVYVDAGNSNWINSKDMAKRLNESGISKADGFALNVSNYYPTSDLIRFGEELSALVGDKHFVIDTSRNGRGNNGGEWCNPNGRALGEKVTTNTGNKKVDGLLWLKNPGESDGTCNGGPSAGVWWPEYALGLAERASY